MKKRIFTALLALVMALSLLPAAAFAAETETPPDWYFLFAIFKNVDADCKDRYGNVTHLTDSMPQYEIDGLLEHAQEFEDYMNSLGIMRAHVDAVVIDAPVTELDEYDGGSFLDAGRAAPLLETKVDLDRYDHVTCCLNLNTATRWAGISPTNIFENGAGISNINFRNGEHYQKSVQNLVDQNVWMIQVYVHEFLHFMEQMSRKWGATFALHREKTHYTGDDDWETYYTDAILNRLDDLDVFPEGGTGVHPKTWQYPPHVLRTMTELTVPSDVTGIGDRAFADNKTLTRVSIPSSVSNIGEYAFYGCTGLAEITLPSSLTGIEKWTFANCSALTRISIPAGVTSIGGAVFQGCSNLTSISLPASLSNVEQFAFASCPSLTDVYYGGTEAQWKAIEISDISNTALNRAAIHCNSLMADVKTTAWFAQPVVWALENGVTNGTGGGKFSPDITCNQAQILTFLWRAKGQPKPSGAVSGTEFYASAVQWAKEQGLISGSFSPDVPCTRADVVTYLWKLAGSPAAETANFSDVPANASYAQAVAWAVSKGVTNGTGNGQFSPDAACTRGQIVTFLYRALA